MVVRYIQVVNLAQCVQEQFIGPVLSKVYYGNTKADAAAIDFDDQFIYDELEIPMSNRKMSMIPLLRDEANAAFVEWKNKIDKIEY